MPANKPLSETTKPSPDIQVSDTETVKQAIAKKNEVIELQNETIQVMRQIIDFQNRSIEALKTIAESRGVKF